MAINPLGYTQSALMGGANDSQPEPYSWEGGGGMRAQPRADYGAPQAGAGGGWGGGGFNYGALAPAIGAIGGGLNQWFQGNNMAGVMNRLSGPLPGQADMEDIARSYKQQSYDLEQAHATPAMLQAARNAARQASAGQGISGPLSASVEAQGVNDVNNQFEQWRRGMLQNVLRQRAGILQQLQQQAMMSRAAQAQAAAERQKAAGGIGSAIGTGIGAIGGALLAPFTGGASLALGPALGGALGGGIGSAASGDYGGGY